MAPNFIKHTKCKVVEKLSNVLPITVTVIDKTPIGVKVLELVLIMNGTYKTNRL